MQALSITDMAFRCAFSPSRSACILYLGHPVHPSVYFILMNNDEPAFALILRQTSIFSANFLALHSFSGKLEVDWCYLYETRSQEPIVWPALLMLD